MEPEVRVASRDDVPGLAAALARAFHDDPAMLFIFPDDDQRRRRLEPMFEATVSRFHLGDGNADVAVRDGVVVGGTFWSPPGRWKPTFWQSLRVAPRMLAIMRGRILAGQQVMASIERIHPAEPHWYLACLGTDPAAQGTGVGSALLRSRLACFDAEGIPVHLETSKEANIPYYQRFGFALSDQTQIPAGPRFWSMWRSPGGS